MDFTHILLLLATFSSTEIYFCSGQEVTTTTEVVCKKDPSGLAFIPNIYICNLTQFCCNDAGTFGCCSNDISANDVKDQIILWSCLIGVILFFGLVIGCYFQDRYCCDRERHFDDQEVYQCCFCCRKRIVYKKRSKLSDSLFPDHVDKNDVGDPIFQQV